eukprot:SM000304S11843  [mRNA]  locus=s304:76346:79253:+ [translate_table: standard]
MLKMIIEMTCSLTLTLTLPCLPQAATAIFTFGDSQADVGTNNYLTARAALLADSIDKANFPPYGETYFHRPTGRFCDGRIVGDFIGDLLLPFLGFLFSTYAHLPVAPPYLRPKASFKHGANFASGGAGVLADTNLPPGKVVGLSQQLAQFQQLQAKALANPAWGLTTAVYNNALFFVTIGSNDYFNYITNKTVSNANPPVVYVAKVVATIGKAIETLYAKGARKFLLPQLPPLGCLPVVRAYTNTNKGCYLPAQLAAEIHNAGLLALIVVYKLTLPKATFVFGKIEDYVVSVINNPRQYGFSKSVDANCGAGPNNALVGCGRNGTYNGIKLYGRARPHPSKYVFWDSFHGTEALYHQVASKLWSGGSKYTTPITVQQLLAK